MMSVGDPSQKTDRRTGSTAWNRRGVAPRAAASATSPGRTFSSSAVTAIGWWSTIQGSASLGRLSSLSKIKGGPLSLRGDDFQQFVDHGAFRLVHGGGGEGGRPLV